MSSVRKVPNLDGAIVISYGDPAYIGRHTLYPERSPVDQLELIHRLVRADGWALSASSSSLAELLPLVVSVVGPNKRGRTATHRVGAWVRPDPPPTTEPTYAWEPVIFKAARLPHLHTLDWLRASHKGARPGLVGAKPVAFYTWLLALLGWRNGDRLDEVFPGTSLLSDMVRQLALPLSVRKGAS